MRRECCLVFRFLSVENTSYPVRAGSIRVASDVTDPLGVQFRPDTERSERIMWIEKCYLVEVAPPQREEN